MTSIRFTYDVQTQQLVYAVIKTDSYFLTTSVTEAIKLAQTK